MKARLLTLFIFISISAFSQKIEDLPKTSTPVGTDLMIIDQTDATKGIRVYDLFGNYVPFDTLNNRLLHYVKISDSTYLYYTQKQADSLLNEVSFKQPLDSLSLDALATPSTTNYTLYADTAENTISFKTGLGSTAQIARESLIKVYNGTGSLIEDGKVVCACGLFNGVIQVEKAIASDRHTALLWATTDIPSGGYGDALVIYGAINNVPTTGLSLGQVYLSGVDSGDVVNTAPSFPNYVYSLGAVTKIDATNGRFEANLAGVDAYNTTVNFHNGTFRETFDFRIISNGTTIKGYLEPADGHPDLTAMFSDGLSTFDTSPADTIVLAPGTDINPQSNYVYIPKSTKVLTVSTSDYPTTEHIRVSTSVLQSAAMTQANGALRNQNINDAIQNTDTDQGHLSHIGERIRIMDAMHWTGTEGTLTVAGTPSDVWVAVTQGQVYQMHKQTFPAQDMQTGDIVYIVNDPVTPYDTTSNLNVIDVDALGNTLNNNWFPIVVWGVANKTGEASHIMVNLPTGSYNSESNAVDDLLNYSVYDIPEQFRGVGFLIARFVIRKASTTFTYNPSVGYLDLRKKFPNSTVGAASGSSGITTFVGLTDTESFITPYEFQIGNAAGNALESPPTLTYNGDSLKVKANAVIDDTLKVGGRIGIGTSTPLSALHINNGVGDLSKGVRMGSGSGYYQKTTLDIYTSIGGVDRAFVSDNWLLAGASSASAAISRFAATATVPVILPERGNNTSGIGSSGNDQVSFIAGSKEIARASENVTEQFIINPQNDLTGTLANPSLAISNESTGWYKPDANSLDMGLNGVNIWNYTTDTTYHDSTLKVGKLFVGGVEVTSGGLPSGNDGDIVMINASGGGKTNPNLNWDDTTLYVNFGTENVLIGKSSGNSLTTGVYNTFLGALSGYSNNNDNNVFVGRASGYNNVSSENTFLGYESGTGNINGASNTMIGASSGSSNTGTNNTFVGRSAGQSNTGSNNTYIGTRSGSSSGTGSNNIFIGNLSGQNETGSDLFYLDNSSTSTPLLWGDFANDIVKINGTQVQSTGIITDNDPTPDVSANNVWTYNGTANSVTVTDFDNPDVGAIYRIIGNSDTYTITINDSGNFNLSGNWVGGVDDVLTILVQADNDYIEISRSDN